MNVGIYKINSPSNKIYIGQSKNILIRRKHYRLLHCKKQVKLYNSFVKYGYENHSFELVHELPNDVEQKVLDVYEQLYMDSYKDAGFELLNLKDAGLCGRVCEESRKKISESHKGEKNPMFGKKLSKEHRNAISESKMGVKRNDAVWNKGKKGVQIAWNKGLKGSQVAWNKGTKGLCKASAETRQLLSAQRMGNKHRLGIKHSVEDRQKISEGLKAMHKKRKLAA